MSLHGNFKSRREDDGGIELEAVSGSKSFQNGSTADEITFIVRDLMK